MKRRPILLAAVLALSIGRSFALETAAPPSPTGSVPKANYRVTSEGDDPGNVFVGHYGETLSLYSDWTAEAVMRGPVEIVYFRESNTSPSSERPKKVELKEEGAEVTLLRSEVQMNPREFIPENFSRLRLMQLMVIPKDAPGGFGSLKQLREAKAEELLTAGLPYDLQEVGEYPWPPDSFWVSRSTPSRLFQLYTQSDKHLFILTSGASPYDEKSDDPVLGSATSRLCNSLSTYLDAFRPRLVAQQNPLPGMLTALVPWTLVAVLGVLLGFLPARWPWLSRLRLTGRAAFGFTSAWHLLAVPILAAAWRLNLDKTVNEASILFCAGLLMPWVCRSISLRLRGQRPWRVWAVSAAVNILPVVAGFTIMRDFAAGSALLEGSQNFWMLGVTLSIMGLLNGAALGIAHDEDAS